LILVVAVALLATHLNAGDLARAFARLDAAKLAVIVFVLGPLAVLLRARRWRCLLPAGDRVPVLAYCGAYVVGVLTNAVLPGRFGDLVKARVICRPGVDYARSLAVVVIDRLLEGLALLVVFAAVLLYTPLPKWASRLGWVAAVATVAALVGLRAAFHYRAGFLRVTERAATALPAPLRTRLLTAAERLLTGCEALAGYRCVGLAMLYAFAVWAVEIAAVMIFLAALAVPAPRFAAATLLLTVLNFGMLVPISPGSVGVYQMLCAFALSLWGVDRELGLMLGIVMQTVLFVPLYLAGLVWVAVAMRAKPRDV
jgi:uncharacterized protein (TIRG00374 family)